VCSGGARNSFRQPTASPVLKREVLEMHRDVLCALLQATTVLNRQPLVCPQQLHLSPMEDLALRCGSSISVHPRFSMGCLQTSSDSRNGLCPTESA